jgi:Ca2+-binding RTX toxin-like protein
LYNASGVAQGNEFKINTYTSEGQAAPSVASLSDGGFIVTWESNGQDGSSTGIYGQRFDSNRNPVSSTVSMPAGGIENVTGGSGNNTLIGTSASNVLVGGAGNDSMSGLAGNDTLTGNGGNDVLDGGSGNDSLNGGTGDTLYKFNYGWGQDTLVDAGGNDTLDFSAIDTALTINLNTTSGSAITPANNALFITGTIENVLKGNGNDTIIGNAAANSIASGAGNDSISGGAGNDTLDGGAGNDTMVRGTGNDIYLVDSTTDTVVENYGEGTDFVQSSASYTLSANVENLILLGSNALYGYGNSGNNQISGNSGNDTLFGNTGNDTLTGDVGNDTYLYTTGWGSDTISDAGGNNTLDFVNYNSNLQINLSATAGDHTNSASSDIFWSGEIIQNVIKGVGNDVITGTSADNFLSGGGGNDTLNGSAGNDTLDGGTGNDSLVGGTGDDLYKVDSSNDIIIENANEGTDTVESTASTFTLGANLENLTLMGSASIQGGGNALNNILLGNSGNNFLGGGDGNDTLDGNAGADTLKGGTGNDTYLFNTGDGQDTIQEADSTVGNLDTLSLDSSITKANVAFFMSGNNLQIGYKGDATDQITVLGQQTSSGSIERFALSDGSFLTNSDINNVIQAMSNYAVSHSVSFSNLSDVENNANLLSIVSSAWHH